MNVAAGPPEAPETLRRRRWVVAGAAVLVLAGILLACWEYLPGVYAWLTDAEAVRFARQLGLQVIDRLPLKKVKL